ncbi:hypothetical protein IVB27_19755 [Bradyrhizobium sp. 197]|uniref:hypothetical protein n=1 Tax=Bradyrhizobium sp. 197 TaxID=2782663 RepID=UPI001FFB1678|nr:hypothetical protein [Bradyrhizobium sp. 197]MCK1476982.1 hypothetical protein [Bradyrhizobium sp. 197]
MKPAKTFKQQARVAEKAAQETADEFVSRQMKALASGFRAQAKVLKKKKKKGKKKKGYDEESLQNQAEPSRSPRGSNGRR